MYSNLLPEPVNFRTPWEDETLERRMSELLSGDGPRVAYVYGTPDTSTFRYRVYNMIEALRGLPGCPIRASWFSAAEIAELRPILGNLTTLVLTRLRISRSVSDLITAARAHGTRIIFDCDDLVFDTRYAQTVSVNNDQDFSSEAHLDSWFAYVGRLQATAQLCDGGITTNAHLAKKLEAVCGGPVNVVRNFLNRRQQEISKRLLEAKVQDGFRGDGRVTIGYFSGSPTHNRDFRIATDSIINIMDKDPNVGVRIVGFMEGHEPLMRFGDRVERIALQDWLNLQVRIAEVDINIAPLQLNEFTQCKSELKFFEAAVVGTYTVASRSHTFEQAIEATGTGTLVNNGDWYKALRQALDFVRDRDNYAVQATCAANLANARYGWDQNTGEIISAITNHTDPPTISPADHKRRYQSV